MFFYIDGIDTDLDAIYAIPSNKRKPVDSNIKNHEWLDNGFKKVYGDKVRSNAVFCVKSIKTARNYGEPYIIYPKDGFRFYYSNEIEDVYISEFYYDNSDKLNDKNIKAAFLYIVLNNDNNICSAKLYNEILKDKFGEFDLDVDKFPKYVKFIENKYPKAAEEFVKHYYKRSTNLNDIKKLGDRNEIMMMCNGYYSIKAE